MAPRKYAEDSRKPLRRSVRLHRATTDVDLLIPVDDPESRITKPKSAPRQKRPTRLDCTTCARTLSRASFPKALTQKCSHDTTTCKACTKTWIAAQLDSVTYDKISCPECPQLMGNADIKANATAPVYGRFDELQRRGIADSIPGWRWCLAPGCRAGQVHPPLLDELPRTKASTRKNSDVKKAENDHICTCNECGAQACVPCDRPLHEGETCAGFQQRMQQFVKDEEASMETIAQRCKQCPQCTRNIQRSSGCDYMICIKCGAGFCWICLLTYAEIRKKGSHAAECIYARPGRIDPHAPALLNNGDNGGVVGNGAWAGNLFNGNWL